MTSASRIRSIAERAISRGLPPADIVISEFEREFVRRHSMAVWDAVAEVRKAAKSTTEKSARRTQVVAEIDDSDTPDTPDETESEDYSDEDDETDDDDCPDPDNPDCDDEAKGEDPDEIDDSDDEPLPTRKGRSILW